MPDQIMEQRQRQSRYHPDTHQQFHWDSTLDTKFCIVAMAIGWDRVEPKQIIKHIGQLQRTIVSSHLQKVRNQIKRRHREIKNHLVPDHISSTVLDQIASHWKNNTQGLSAEDIEKMLQSV